MKPPWVGQEGQPAKALGQPLAVWVPAQPLAVWAPVPVGGARPRGGSWTIPQPSFQLLQPIEQIAQGKQRLGMAQINQRHLQ